MPFEFAFENESLLYADDFSNGFDNWHHEGIGEIAQGPDQTMQLHCHGSAQGGRGCMAFWKHDLPDGVAYEYDLTVRSHGGLIINYLNIRGINGEDMIEDADKLEPRNGIMANYFSKVWGLQSYHISVSRFNDKAEHTGTCNIRRNPGGVLVAHGKDMVTEIDRTFHIRVVKFEGYIGLYVDGTQALGVTDRDTSRFPIPDHGKFGFRLIGSDVKADIANFQIHKLKRNERLWKSNEDYDPR